MTTQSTSIESFEEHLRRVNLSGARLAYLLAAMLVPATFVLDWINVPEKAGELLAIRIVTSLLSLVGLSITYWAPSQRHPVLLGAGPPLLCAASIELMILKLEGPASPYYAGLNLCILAVAVLYTWKWQHSLLVTSLILLFWLVPALPLAWSGNLDYKAALNNLVFLVDTAVIAVASAVIRYRSAEREHRVRSKLAATTDELGETLEQLKEHDRLKNEFFANISHELRTPLTLILSPVEDLLTKGLDERLTAPLSIVRRNAQRLLRLIDDLLDLARLDGGGLRLNVARVNLTDLANRVVEVARPAAQAKQLRLVSLPADSALVVYGDPHRLEIILTNLLGNALKFTPKGGSITCEARQLEGHVEISIRDSGPGIPESDLEKIFNRFYQVEGSERREQGGAGIGLPLARSLAELHGGQLTVENAPGGGARFSLLLRTGRAHLDEQVIERRRVRAESHPGRRLEDRKSLPPEVESKPVTNTNPHPNIRLGHGRRGRILVAEDEADLRSFIISALNEEFDVIAAEDGRHALNLVKTQRPDLILADVMMPRMSGTDLCRAIKEDHSLRATPVILLTARSGADSTLEGYSSGADDFISKPFHTRVLIARVKAQLKLRALGLQLADQARLASASALAAGIAHEVKNPLNAVLNASRALPAVSLESPGGEKLLRTISEGAHRIGEIVSVLEDQVRPADSGARSICDLDSGVESTLRLLDYRLNSVKVHYQRAASHHVVASGRELNQVILNLIDNAIKANPKNIWIGVERDAKSVVLSISDDGRGIPREFEDVIFEPFFTTRQNGEGSGLGLYLARRIVTEYGGDLSYSARKGGGSLFVIRLPALEAVA